MNCVKIKKISKTYGKYVVIDHGYGFETYYAHLSKTLVKDGEKVTPELVEQLGYRSESAFRRTFKKVTGKNISAFQTA